MENQSPDTDMPDEACNRQGAVVDQPTEENNAKTLDSLCTKTSSMSDQSVEKRCHESLVNPCTISTSVTTDEPMTDKSKVEVNEPLVMSPSAIVDQTTKENNAKTLDGLCAKTTSANQPMELSDSCDVAVNNVQSVQGIHKPEMVLPTNNRTDVPYNQNSKIDTFLSDMKATVNQRSDKNINDIAASELIEDCQKLVDADNAYRMRDPFLSGSSSESDSDSDESSSSDESSVLSAPAGSGGSGAESEEEPKKTSAQSKTTNKSIKNITKTKGEFLIEDLPPIEDLDIEVDSSVEMAEIGKVAQIVGLLAVIQANHDTPALNMDSILFDEKREPLGQVFETFGRVTAPLYTMRFNSEEHMKEKNIEIGLVVFCAPKMNEYTHFVFVDQLKRMRGSDASWENNNEPPDRYLDYSDDEGERRAKGKKRQTDKDKDDANTVGKRNRQNKNKKMDSWPPENDPEAPQGPSWQPGVKDIRNPWSGPQHRPWFQQRGPRPPRPERFNQPPRSPAPRVPFGRLPPPSHWMQRAPPPGWGARFPARPRGPFQMSIPPPNFGRPPPPVGCMTSASQAPAFTNVSNAPQNAAYNPVVWTGISAQANGQLNASQATGNNLTLASANNAAVLQQTPVSFLQSFTYPNQPNVSSSHLVKSQSSTPPLVANLLPGTQSPQTCVPPQLSLVQNPLNAATSAAHMGPPISSHLLNLPPPPPPIHATAGQNSSAAWVNGQPALVDPRHIQALQYAAVANQNIQPPAVFPQYTGQPYFQWQQ